MQGVGGHIEVMEERGKASHGSDGVGEDQSASVRVVKEESV